MKRRHFISCTGVGVLTSLGSASWFRPAVVAAKPSGNALGIDWLGHSAFLFTGNGVRVLVNPFRAIGCTAGYRLPKVRADVVLISSQLWDEGAAEDLPGNPKILFTPGVYDFNGLKFQSISSPHDRLGGKRFGQNLAWRWSQGGLSIVHMGGAAAPISEEQKILLGSPDVAFIPVGGGPKNYTPTEAKQTLEYLNPRIMIPTQYATVAADRANCELVPVKDFLNLVQGMNVGFIKGHQLTLSQKDLPASGTLIRVFNERGLLA